MTLASFLKKEQKKSNTLVKEKKKTRNKNKRTQYVTDEREIRTR